MGKYLGDGRQEFDIGSNCGPIIRRQTLVYQLFIQNMILNGGVICPLSQNRGLFHFVCCDPDRFGIETGRFRASQHAMLCLATKNIPTKFLTSNGIDCTAKMVLNVNQYGSSPKLDGVGCTS